MGCGPSKKAGTPTGSGAVTIHSDDQEMFKVIIVGDSMVGKTSLIHRLCHDTFSTTIIAANIQDFVWLETKIYSHFLKLNHKVVLDDVSVDLQIWDTAGQERFRVITSSFYRGSHGIIYAFDVGEAASFQNCEKWIVDAERYVREDNICQVIVATKCDHGGKRVITQEQAESFAQKMQLPYFETSSKDNIGVNETFIALHV